MLCFAGFELDADRARLRGPNGEAIRLRPKSFDMLRLFATNAGRVLSKQDLIEAIWPNVHVGDDSIFQCIREIRTALGDDRRQMIKLVSGRGYLFEAEVSVRPDSVGAAEEAEPAAKAACAELDTAATLEMQAEPAGKRFRFGLRGAAVLATVAGLVAVLGLAAAATMLVPDFIFARSPPTIVVMPITGAGNNPQTAAMAASVTERLTDGLAKIDKIRVLAPPREAVLASHQAAATQAPEADLVVSGELRMEAGAWTIQARMSHRATGQVQWANSVSVAAENSDVSLQQIRLAAGVGHPLALRINAIINSGQAASAADHGLPTGNAKVVIEQAMASINQTTPERFKAAQAMLENALAADPDNVDLEAALAAHMLRGIQLVWYNPADVPATERAAQSMLERALRLKPTYIPVIEGYCRLLTATNQFIESVVACGKALSFDPWDGLALYNLGLSQLRLGRFEDGLATFRQADQFDTPRMARWTWLLGAGLAALLMDRDEEAVSWLTKSIAVTPGTGRTHALLATAYQRLGRTEEAKAALARTLELRPGSNAANIPLPTRNVSPVYLEASQRVIEVLIGLGLPER